MLFPYILKSALLLTVLYGAFALLLSRETFHRLNRLALLSVLVASVVLPAVRISVEVPKESHILGTVHRPPLTPPLRGEHRPSPLTLPLYGEGVLPLEGELEGVFLWNMQWASFLYLSGFVLSLAFLCVQLLQLVREIRGGIRLSDEYGNVVVVRAGQFAPYSFLHYIIISASDYAHLRRPILAHEQAHIRLGHTFDLLLLELVKALQWFNPFVYLLGRDLKAVHEYEADEAVLHLGIDAKTYQLLLVTKAASGRLQTVCNSLSHHSLKKRILMMQKKQSNRWLMTKTAILPALMALAIVAFASPKESPEALLQTTDKTAADGDMPRLLDAYIPKEGATDHSSKVGPGIKVTWLKGTWVEKDDGSFIEEHPVCTYPWLFRQKDYKIMLDGKALDIYHLPDLPASALRKMEVSLRSHSVNLITTAVSVPAGVKGNINPELTILLTGTPPKDSGAKTSIWFRPGMFDGFSWKNYTITSWNWDVEDIGQHLQEVAIRHDHNVRINVCRGVPDEHIDRLTRLMKQHGVTHYTFFRQ